MARTSFCRHHQPVARIPCQLRSCRRRAPPACCWLRGPQRRPPRSSPTPSSGCSTAGERRSKTARAAESRQAARASRLSTRRPCRSPRTPTTLRHARGELRQAALFAATLRLCPAAAPAACCRSRTCLLALPSPLYRRSYLSWDDYFMAVAFLSAQRSKDPNKQARGAPPAALQPQAPSTDCPALQRASSHCTGDCLPRLRRWAPASWTRTRSSAASDTTASPAAAPTQRWVGQGAASGLCVQLPVLATLSLLRDAACRATAACHSRLFSAPTCECS